LPFPFAIHVRKNTGAWKKKDSASTDVGKPGIKDRYTERCDITKNVKSSTKLLSNKGLCIQVSHNTKTLTHFHVYCILVHISVVLLCIIESWIICWFADWSKATEYISNQIFDKLWMEPENLRLTSLPFW